MLWRLIRVLIAFAVVLAATLPVSARTVPMPTAMTQMVLWHCPDCVPQARTGANPNKALPCQALACPGAIPTLPASILVRGHVFQPSGYPLVSPARWTGARHAPDPFPPKSIVPV